MPHASIVVIALCDLLVLTVNIQKLPVVNENISVIQNFKFAPIDMYLHKSDESTTKKLLVKRLMALRPKK